MGTEEQATCWKEGREGKNKGGKEKGMIAGRGSDCFVLLGGDLD